MEEKKPILNEKEVLTNAIPHLLSAQGQLIDQALIQLMPESKNVHKLKENYKEKNAHILTKENHESAELEFLEKYDEGEFSSSLAEEVAGAIRGNMTMLEAVDEADNNKELLDVLKELNNSISDLSTKLSPETKEQQTPDTTALLEGNNACFMASLSQKTPARPGGGRGGC